MGLRPQMEEGMDMAKSRAKKRRDFEEAREYVRDLGLENSREWRAWCKSGERPHDIPASPDVVYGDEWNSWPDWFGSRSRWLPFEEAREFVRGVGLTSWSEWLEWRQSPARPSNIPTSPNTVYKYKWQDMGDWLGTGDIYRRDSRFLPFVEAREFVRDLGLKNDPEWRAWCKSGERPHNIPAAARVIYREEWRGMADWLGYKPLWNRHTLLAFLEDLRPRLKDLEETELYLILQQGEAQDKPLNPHATRPC